MEIERTIRYTMRSRAQVALPNKTVLSGHTLDISTGGICIVLSDRIPLGVSCLVRFEMNVKGKTLVITSASRSVYGVFASNGGFRVGFQFLEEDQQRSTLIRALGGKKPVGEASSKAVETGAAHGSPSG